MSTAEIIGYVATVFTVVALLPQIWKIWKIHETKDISLATFIIFFCGAVSWTIYGVLLSAWPIIITNSIVAMMQLTIIGFKLKYG